MRIVTTISGVDSQSGINESWESARPPTIRTFRVYHASCSRSRGSCKLLNRLVKNDFTSRHANLPHDVLFSSKHIRGETKRRGRHGLSCSLQAAADNIVVLRTFVVYEFFAILNSGGTAHSIPS
jgi:hypothetical protein